MVKQLQLSECLKRNSVMVSQSLQKTCILEFPRFWCLIGSWFTDCWPHNFDRKLCVFSVFHFANHVRVMDLKKRDKMVSCGLTTACRRCINWKLVMLVIVQYQGVLQELSSHWNFDDFEKITQNYTSIATINACQQPPELAYTFE